MPSALSTSSAYSISRRLPSVSGSGMAANRPKRAGIVRLQLRPVFVARARQRRGLRRHRRTRRRAAPATAPRWPTPAFSMSANDDFQRPFGRRATADCRHRGGMDRRHVMVMHVDARRRPRRLRGHDVADAAPRRQPRTETEGGNSASDEIAARRAWGLGRRRAAGAGAEKPMASGLPRSALRFVRTSRALPMPRQYCLCVGCFAELNRARASASVRAATRSQRSQRRDEALKIFAQNPLDSPPIAFMWGLCRC